MASMAPIEPAAWPDTLADIRRQMGTPLNVHCALASYPAWLRAWFPFRNHVVHGTSLSSRQYELVVLRVATLTDAAYEWEHHVITAKEAGLGEEEIGRVRAGGDAPGWSRDESALLRAVDECIADRCIRTSTLDALGESCSPEQVLDIVATVTMYHAMAIVTRTFAIPIDEEKPSFSIENVE